jgi:hypothetical protein
MCRSQRRLAKASAQDGLSEAIPIKPERHAQSLATGGLRGTRGLLLRNVRCGRAANPPYENPA